MRYYCNHRAEKGRHRDQRMEMTTHLRAYLPSVLRLALAAARPWRVLAANMR
jgi:hypothetical protein